MAYSVQMQSDGYEEFYELLIYIIFAFNHAGFMEVGFAKCFEEFYGSWVCKML